MSPCFQPIKLQKYCLDLYIFAGFQYQTCLENRQNEQFVTVFNYCLETRWHKTVSYCMFKQQRVSTV